MWFDWVLTREGKLRDIVTNGVIRTHACDSFLCVFIWERMAMRDTHPQKEIEKIKTCVETNRRTPLPLPPSQAASTDPQYDVHGTCVSLPLCIPLPPDLLKTKQHDIEQASSLDPHGSEMPSTLTYRRLFSTSPCAGCVISWEPIAVGERGNWAPRAPRDVATRVRCREYSFECVFRRGRRSGFGRTDGWAVCVCAVRDGALL